MKQVVEEGQEKGGGGSPKITVDRSRTQVVKEGLGRREEGKGEGEGGVEPNITTYFFLEK